jgi:hypothetical protein
MEHLYSDKDIRRRMHEFLGGPGPEEATSVYISRCDRCAYNDLHVVHPRELDSFLDQDMDVARSLWDLECLVVDLDIEYVNFDFPAEPYLDMERSFRLQQRVEQVARRTLLEYGIEPLHLLSGRGHHFVWQIRRFSPVYSRLVEFGRITERLGHLYALRHPPRDLEIEPDLGKAFAGLGLIMEFLAHCIKQRGAPRSEIPVEVTAVEVGPATRGREMVSIDISEYGDPLHTRMLRIPFSVYRKPLEKGLTADPLLAVQIPSIYMVPVPGESFSDPSGLMRDPFQIMELARQTCTQIPDQTEATAALVEAYAESELRQFHDWYYEEDHDTPQDWALTYDQTPLENLPGCTRFILENPNDYLLKPAGIAQVTRAMMSMGWHPRHVAGLIRSKYERDYGWGPQWDQYDQAARADFYTRLFAGLFVAGTDELIDMNCHSTKEKHFCFYPEGHCRLDQYRVSLIERKKHGRLGCGPFNRLFLPDQDL